MPIAFDPIELGFMETLRAQPAFAGWRKRRKRCLWRALGDVEQGVELLRYRESFENRQLVSLGLYVSVPCEREWPVYVPPEVWSKGRLYRRACLVPGQGAGRRGDAGQRRRPRPLLCRGSGAMAGHPAGRYRAACRAMVQAV
ncbi:hypothetical protein ACOTB6_20850 [Achromobacter xylosoxidans]